MTSIQPRRGSALILCLLILAAMSALVLAFLMSTNQNHENVQGQYTAAQAVQEVARLAQAHFLNKADIANRDWYIVQSPDLEMPEKIYSSSPDSLWGFYHADTNPCAKEMWKAAAGGAVGEKDDDPNNTYSVDGDNFEHLPRMFSDARWFYTLDISGNVAADGVTFVDDPMMLLNGRFQPVAMRFGTDGKSTPVNEEDAAEIRYAARYALAWVNLRGMKPKVKVMAHRENNTGAYEFGPAFSRDLDLRTTTGAAALDKYFDYLDYPDPENPKRTMPELDEVMSFFGDGSITGNSQFSGYNPFGGAGTDFFGLARDNRVDVLPTVPAVPTVPIISTVLTAAAAKPWYNADAGRVVKLDKLTFTPKNDPENDPENDPDSYYIWRNFQELDDETLNPTGNMIPLKNNPDPAVPPNPPPFDYIKVKDESLTIETIDMSEPPPRRRPYLDQDIPFYLTVGNNQSYENSFSQEVDIEVDINEIPTRIMSKPPVTIDINSASKDVLVELYMHTFRKLMKIKVPNPQNPSEDKMKVYAMRGTNDAEVQVNPESPEETIAVPPTTFKKIIYEKDGDYPYNDADLYLFGGDNYELPKGKFNRPGLVKLYHGKDELDLSTLASVTEFYYDRPADPFPDPPPPLPPLWRRHRLRNSGLLSHRCYFQTPGRRMGRRDYKTKKRRRELFAA